MHELLVSIKLAIKNLRSNLGRTTLSLVGIVIGVMSVILVLSLGAGVKSFIIKQVTAFGTDIFEVEVKVPKTKHTSSQNIGGMVGGTQITTFKLEDAKKIAKLPNVGPWYAGIMSQQIISFENKKKQAFLMGVTAGVTEADKQAKIASGEMYTEEDEAGLKQVVALGSNMKDYFFGSEDAVGKVVKIKGQAFRVVAVLEKRGFTGGFNFDDVIYVPLQTLQKKIMGINHVQFAIFKLRDVSLIDVTMLDATDVMRRQHNITDPEDDDFAVISILEAVDILNQVLFVINALLLALTSISLIVGGVGIMNVMYVAVTERTSEIGLRKAVGAKNSHILWQFIFEAIFLTLSGGLVGVILGLISSEVAEIVLANMGFSLSFPLTWYAIVIGLGFSAAVGIIFGYYPARRASRLAPMEALRKE